MKFYRYDVATHFSFDPDTETSRYGGMSVNLHEFFLVKETPKCYRIAYNWDKSLIQTKLVKKIGKKKFAYPSKEEAAKSFLYRKQAHVRILKEKLHRAKSELQIAENLNEKLHEIITLN
jgi:hypothetical protein